MDLAELSMGRRIRCNLAQVDNLLIPMKEYLKKDQTNNEKETMSCTHSRGIVSSARCGPHRVLSYCQVQ